MMFGTHINTQFVVYALTMVMEPTRFMPTQNPSNYLCNFPWPKEGQLLLEKQYLAILGRGVVTSGPRPVILSCGFQH